MPRIIRVFYINHPKDSKLLQELEAHMGVLSRKGFISEWSESKGLAGDEKDRMIDDNLNSADIIVPLISADFFASRDCGAEMKQAVGRHRAGEACVIPIFLRPFVWKEEEDLESLVILPRDPKSINEPKAVSKWSDRNEAFVFVVKVICKVIERLHNGEAVRAVAGDIDLDSSEEIGTIIKRAKDNRARQSDNLLPFLCDRAAQDKTLEDEIKKWFVEEGTDATPRPRKPLVGIVQGDDQECVSMYKRRLQEFSLRRFLRADARRAIRSYYMKLPTAVSKAEDCLEDFQRDLAEKLTYSRYLSREQISEEIARSGAPVFIYSSLDTELWDANAPEVIRTFLRFWDRLSPLPPTSQLIACLLLKHNMRSPEWAARKEQARQFIAGLDLSLYPGVTVLKLPELAPVPRGEALNWVREGINFEGFCDQHPAEFCDTEGGEEYICEEIYESAETVKPMKLLAAKLDTLLETYRCRR
ncbi:MAG TPA: toll/interleukin-1 receptor domain-containing protein [Blastocatellia bacterium]|nr:toll/interleukin-1 receptor domain-containing protein [Blastocatellia bacterium]